MTPMLTTREGLAAACHSVVLAHDDDVAVVDVGKMDVMPKNA